MRSSAVHLTCVTLTSQDAPGAERLSQAQFVNDSAHLHALQQQQKQQSERQRQPPLTPTQKQQQQQQQQRRQQQPQSPQRQLQLLLPQHEQQHPAQQTAENCSLELHAAHEDRPPQSHSVGVNSAALQLAFQFMLANHPSMPMSAQRLSEILRRVGSSQKFC